MAEDWGREWRQDMDEPANQPDEGAGDHAWGAHALPPNQDEEQQADESGHQPEHAEPQPDTYEEEGEAVEETAPDGDVEETVVEEEGEPQAEPTPSRATTKQGPKAPQLSPQVVRQIITKVEQLQTIDNDQLVLVANTLGVRPEMDKIISAIFMGQTKTETLAELRKLGGETAIVATTQVMGMKPKEIKTLWDMTRALGGDLPKRLPRGNMAVIRLVEAVQGLQDLPGKVDAVEELLKR